ncbi:hypothetical protein HYR69_01115 [Candidatus Sumerlaeota bacterium]|nr:hypothetical protein [Candidatus Sumerlaeota bacterium]
MARRHREFQDEPLLLALAYDPLRGDNNVYLFELIENFGSNEITPHGELFEIGFESTDEFPLTENQELHLVLSNPVEFNAALREHWRSAEEIRDAVRRGDFVCLYGPEGDAANRIFKELRQ